MVRNFDLESGNVSGSTEQPGQRDRVYRLIYELDIVIIAIVEE